MAKPWEEYQSQGGKPWESYGSTPTQNSTSQNIQSGGETAFQGATLGFGDELAGLGGAISGKLFNLLGLGDNKTFAEDYRTIRDKYRGDVEKFAKENPKSALALQVAGSLPTAFASVPLMAGKGALTTGAAYGGLTGLGESNAEDIGGMIKDTAKGALLGGAVGYGADKVIGGISRVINPNAVKRLKESGVDLTPGQALGGAWKTAEEKATSLPLAGSQIAKAQTASLEDWNKSVINKVLEPIGESVDSVGYQGIKDAGDLISASYNKVLPKLKVQQDPEFMTAVANVKNMANTGDLPTDVAEQLNKLIDSKVLGKFTNHGLMTGETMKSVDSEIGRIIREKIKSENSDVRQMGNALREVQSNLRDMVMRNNPEYAPQLSAIDDAFKKYIRVERAASGVGTKEGVFTPAQLLSSSKATSGGIRSKQFAKGEALFQDIANQGKTLVGNTYPDSGTGGRLGQIGAMAAYVTNPLLGIGEASIAAAYGTQQGRNALMALVAKRPEIAGKVANALRSQGKSVGNISAIQANQ